MRAAVAEGQAVAPAARAAWGGGDPPPPLPAAAAPAALSDWWAGWGEYFVYWRSRRQGHLFSFRERVWARSGRDARARFASRPWPPGRREDRSREARPVVVVGVKRCAAARPGETGRRAAEAAAERGRWVA